jgi:xanthine/CO dehydrogenase XdhC/CoxF family maturation factor
VSEVQRIVALSRRAQERGDRLCLATVVHVEGSAYRKPGARLLLCSSGEHAGTISGGCLEAEVSRKAWWLTAKGPSVERYSSFADEDGGLPYGLGCGGTVSLLLEQGEPVHAVIDALARGIDARQAAVLIVALQPSAEGGAGTVAVLSPSTSGGGKPGLTAYYLRDSSLPGELVVAARNALEEQRSCCLTGRFDAWGKTASPSVSIYRASPPDDPGPGLHGGDGALPAYWIEYLEPPPALTIFGAGDDAQPLADFALALGWRVTVADGRAHLARRYRFPRAHLVRVIEYAHPGLRAACGIAGASAPGEPGDNGRLRRTLPDPALSGDLTPEDLAVVLTHSYEQDRALLAALLPCKLRYLGILGPRHRTERLLLEVTPALGMTIEEGFLRLHSPVGLDLGTGDPAAVALSIIAEMQAVLHDRRVEITHERARETPLQFVQGLHGR